MTDHILEMRAIEKTFPGVRALDHVSLAVRRGEVHAICGENGAGKSTLIKVLAGVYPHGDYHGDIVLDGEVVEFGGIKDSEARGVVVIHQELALIPYLSIAENIFLGNEHARRGVISWHETTTHAQRLMRRVGLDENPLTRVGDLGVGKQQLVEIAKALSKDVRLLILDEPTAALNEDDSDRLLQLIRELKAEGISSILISHKLGEVLAVADEITVIRDGRTVESMRIDGDAPVDEARIIRGMVGRDLAHRFPPRTSRVGDVVLSVRDWTVFHPLDHERKVVNAASIDLRAGEIVGLAGLMGAGRTELAMSVFGHSYGHGITGTLVKDGQEIRARSVPEAVEHGLAYATEDRKHFGLNLLDTISRNICVSRLDKITRRLRVDDRRETEVAEGYRTSMRIKTPTVAEVTGKLSGGNQQKVVLSKWLFSDPDVLILDEPTRGIDIGAKYEIYTIINELAASGKAILMISSELPELLGMCDRIYTMSQGRITGEFARGQADQEALMHKMTQEREQEVVAA